MKKIICYIVSVSFSVLVLGSCKKGDHPHYTIPQELKDYFGYQKGSYWVFEDLKTNETDSFYQTIIYNHDVDYGDLVTEEMDNTIKQFKADIDWQLIVDPGATDLILSRVTPVVDVVDYTFFTKGYPFNIGSQTGQGSSIIRQTNHYPSRTFGSMSANDVYELCFDSSPKNIHDTIYINYQQGLLELKVNNDMQHHDWLLKRYNIIR